MKDIANPMVKFDFLIGDWNLDFQVPKSRFNEATTGSGTGTFHRELNDRVVFFNYQSLLKGKATEAHGVFNWAKSVGIYRFWWFESSGHFMTANCDFPDDKTLYVNWNDTLLIQTFKKTGEHKVVLQMEHPNDKGGFDPIMKVIFTRIKPPAGVDAPVASARGKKVKK